MSDAKDARWAAVTRVARLYHEQGMRQPEIARRLGISQSMISRYLRAASESGIVKTVIQPPLGTHPELEDAVRDRFSLLDVVVADAEGTAEDVRAAVARAAGAYVEATLSAGDAIGVSSWSSTLMTMVDAMPQLQPRGVARVVQVLGGIGLARAQIEATRLTVQLAELTGARPIFVAAPGLAASRSDRMALLQDRYIAAAAGEWAALTQLLLGIGALAPSPKLRESGNSLPSAELEALFAAGAVGDVCLRYFDADGGLVDAGLGDRVLGISPAQIRSVPRRIGVAGGSEKREAIAAALRGGWVNLLVTDAGVARWLTRDMVR